MIFFNCIMITNIVKYECDIEKEKIVGFKVACSAE